MDEKGIPYTENNSREEMIALGMTQVPILSVDKVLLGFPEANKWVNEQTIAER
jgi:hypothetical protein